MASETVVLGVPGDWQGARDAPDAYATRAGGVPAWPDACAPPDELLACARCRRRLSLVLQTAAPLLSAPDRLLYIFACLRPGCVASADAWCVLRAQAAWPEPQAPQPQPQQQPPQQQQPAKAADDWGVASLDDWGGGGGGSSSFACPAAVDDGEASLLELSAALDVAALAPGPAANVKRSLSMSDADGRSRTHAPAAQHSATGAAPAPTLPPFYVVAIDEPARGGPAGASLSPAAAAAAAATADADGEAWGGEAYERSSVRGVEEATLKFLRRLSRCPDQVVRYGRGGAPAWPSARRPPPAAGHACELCGKRRVFEAQLAPALIHFFGAPAAAWGWSAVMVSTCDCALQPAETAAAAAMDSGAEGGRDARRGWGWAREAAWTDSVDDGEASALDGLLAATAAGGLDRLVGDEMVVEGTSEE